MKKEVDAMDTRSMRNRIPGNEKGVALVIALIVTMVVIIMIASTLYVIMRSTSMSGAGKRYQTAAEAADGAVELMRDSLRPLIDGEPESGFPFTVPSVGALSSAVNTENSSVTVGLTLPSMSSGSFEATITLQRLFIKKIEGTSNRYPPVNTGVGGVSVFYRINSVVAGTDGSRAEATALYRFVN